MAYPLTVLTAQALLLSYNSEASYGRVKLKSESTESGTTKPIISSLSQYGLSITVITFFITWMSVCARTIEAVGKWPTTQRLQQQILMKHSSPYRAIMTAEVLR